MDQLTYQYPKYASTTENINLNRVGKIMNNRLRYVHDEYTTSITDDIESQTTLSLSEVQDEKLPEQTTDNFSYDEIGNLTKDTKENITAITWNVYGKIQSITKTTGSINYTYDASGNRITKTANGKTTIYVRDASGNVMSIYGVDNAVNSGNLTQMEAHLYGSSRLGVFELKRDVSAIAQVNY